MLQQPFLAYSYLTMRSLLIPFAFLDQQTLPRAYHTSLLLVNNRSTLTIGKRFIDWTRSNPRSNPPYPISSKCILSLTILSYLSQPSSYSTPSTEWYPPTRPMFKSHLLLRTPPPPPLPLSPSRTRNGVPAASAPSSLAVSLRSSGFSLYGLCSGLEKGNPVCALLFTSDTYLTAILGRGKSGVTTFRL